MYCCFICIKTDYLIFIDNPPGFADGGTKASLDQGPQPSISVLDRVFFLYLLVLFGLSWFYRYLTQNPSLNQPPLPGFAERVAWLSST